MLALLKVDNIEQWSEVIMQLTTILYLKIPVYDDILQIYQDFWTNFKLYLARQKVSIQEYIFFSKGKILKILD
jgi:hypothetical protein